MQNNYFTVNMSSSCNIQVEDYKQYSRVGLCNINERNTNITKQEFRYIVKLIN